MILSSPFSRQNRSHQTWTSSSNGPTASSANGANSSMQALQFASLRRQSANESKQLTGGISSSNNMTNGYRPATSNKSQTLNRLDFQKRRQQHQLPSPRAQPPPAPIYSSVKTTPPKRSLPNNEIYAPASIASPRELAHYKKPSANPAADQSAHYAASSLRGYTPSESGKSGRESALGNLLERFGTLRRKAKWRRSVRKAQTNGFSGSNTSEPPPTPLPLPVDAPPPLPQQTALDPEIYASGRRAVLADEIYAEGSLAIDGNSRKRLIQYEINEQLMSEGERRVIIDEPSKRQFTYQQLVGSLTNWINDELAQQRIIIGDLQDDLHDGLVLGKLIEKLQGVKLDLVEVTQNEVTQKAKLARVFETINRLFQVQARWAQIRWSVEGIHQKNLVEIIQLLITLAIYYKAPFKLPSSVPVSVIVIDKLQGQLQMRSQEMELIPQNELTQQQIGTATTKRDAFDTLVEFAPEKLAIVKQALVKFANRHLNKINMSCNSPLRGAGDESIMNPEQFSDGLLLVFLISSLEDYFVPLGNLFTASPKQPSKAQMNQTLANSHHQNLVAIDANNNQDQTMGKTALEPESYINSLSIEKLHNVNLALQLMREAGVEIKGQVRAEDIVNGDLRCVLRVLYALFSRYKHI